MGSCILQQPWRRQPNIVDQHRIVRNLYFRYNLIWLLVCELTLMVKPLAPDREWSFPNQQNAPALRFRIAHSLQQLNFEHFVPCPNPFRHALRVLPESRERSLVTCLSRSDCNCVVERYLHHKTVKIKLVIFYGSMQLLRVSNALRRRPE